MPWAIPFERIGRKNNVVGAAIHAAATVPTGTKFNPLILRCTSKKLVLISSVTVHFKRADPLFFSSVKPSSVSGSGNSSETSVHQGYNTDWLMLVMSTWFVTASSTPDGGLSQLAETLFPVLRHQRRFRNTIARFLPFIFLVRQLDIRQCGLRGITRRIDLPEPVDHMT